MIKEIISVIRKSFFVNLFLIIIKIVFGYIGNSKALIVDGIHSLSDLITDVAVMAGSLFSAKPADEKHPYGHGKAEYLLSIFIGVAVISLGINLITRLSSSEIVIPHIIVIYVSFVTIVLKLLLSEYLLKQAGKYKSDILLSSGRESRADVITSVIVLISAILMQFDIKYLNVADSVASILIGLFVVKVGIDIIIRNMSLSIGEQICDPEYRKKIEELLLDSKLVKGIENLIILNYGHYYKVLVDVKLEGTVLLYEAHQHVDVLEDKLKKFDEKIKFITVHMSPFAKKVD